MPLISSLLPFMVCRAVDRKRRSMYDIYKRIDTSYYGYKDDDDGLLEKVEIDQEDDVVIEERKEREMQEEKEKGFVGHVSLSDEEIKKMVLEKKRELLSKYGSEELLEEEGEAKAILIFTTRLHWGKSFYKDKQCLAGNLVLG
nr:hypothetical protein [Tanacetum cinerariifolium]